MVSRTIPLATVLLALGFGAGCGMNDSSSGSGGPFRPSESGDNQGSAGNGTSPPLISDSDGQQLPPETELDQSFRAPVATGKLLWSANPVSGRVALIDAQTLAVRMTNGGFGPTYLAAVPSKAGTDSAIVINVGSHDASFVQGDRNANQLGHDRNSRGRQCLVRERRRQVRDRLDGRGTPRRRCAGRLERLLRADRDRSVGSATYEHASERRLSA